MITCARMTANGRVAATLFTKWCQEVRFCCSRFDFSDNFVNYVAVDGASREILSQQRSVLYLSSFNVENLIGFEFCFSKFCFGKVVLTTFLGQIHWARTLFAYSSDWSHSNFGRKNVNNHAQIAKDEWISMRDGEDIHIFVRFCLFLSLTIWLQTSGRPPLLFNKTRHGVHTCIRPTDRL